MDFLLLVKLLNGGLVLVTRYIRKHNLALVSTNAIIEDIANEIARAENSG